MCSMPPSAPAVRYDGRQHKNWGPTQIAARSGGRLRKNLGPMPHEGLTALVVVVCCWKKHRRSHRRAHAGASRSARSTSGLRLASCNRHRSCEKHCPKRIGTKPDAWTRPPCGDRGPACQRCDDQCFVRRAGPPCGCPRPPFATSFHASPAFLARTAMCCRASSTWHRHSIFGHRNSTRGWGLTASMEGVPRFLTSRH